MHPDDCFNSPQALLNTGVQSQSSHPALPLPNHPPTHPRLQHLPFLAQHHQIRPVPLPQHAHPAPLQRVRRVDAHQRGHVLRHRAHRCRQRAPAPRHEVADALRQGAAAADQRFRVLFALAVDDGLGAGGVGGVGEGVVGLLALRVRDLRVARVDAGRDGGAGELDAVGDEDSAVGGGAVKERDGGWVQVVAVGDEGVVGRWGRVGGGEGDEAGEAGDAGGEGRHGVEGVGEGGCAGVQGGEALVVGGGGVAEGDADGVGFG